MTPPAAITFCVEMMSGDVANGVFSDAASALAADGSGVVIGAVGSATNQVTIIGTPYAVALSSGRTVDVVPGSVFVGGLNGGGSGVLNLETGTVAGMLTGLGGSITGFATVAVDVGAVWTLAGPSTIAAGDTLAIAGTLTNLGKLSAPGVVLDQGVLVNRGSLDGYVDLYGGVVTNAAGGVIAGSYFGVIGDSNKIGGLVVNAGLISAPDDIGVVLRQAGVLDNQASGTITGSVAGAYFIGDDGTLTNDGRIAATGTGTISVGIGFWGTGSVGNGSAAVIRGQHLGVAAYNQAITLTNAGQIDGVGSLGVALYYGGSVSNSGTIQGGQVAVYLTAGRYSPSGSSAGAVTNSGVLSAGGGQAFSVGVQAFGAATVVNQAGGTISGAKYGISIERGVGTVINAGTIVGPEAVYLEAGYRNLLIIEPGAVFSGLVDGGNTIGASVASTLALGAGSGTLTGLGSQFIDFGSVLIEAGGTWTLGSGDTLAAGVTLIDQGFLSIGGLTGAGAITLQAEATLQMTAPVSSGISFASGADATMIVPAGITLGSAIAGFGVGDRFAVAGMVTSAVASHGTVVINGSHGTRTVLTDVAGLANGALVTEWDASTGMTYIEPRCFAAGTRLLTPDGERRIATLAVGDRLRTVLPDQEEEIVWIGCRRIDCRRHPRPEKIWPVRIAAGAFGIGMPNRTLFLSPNHAVFVNGVLIPVRLLVNGGSVRQVKRASIEYWHVELRRHSVVLADGLPAESYLDIGADDMFADRGSAVALHPDLTALTWEVSGCAPLILSGPELAEARRVVADARGYDLADARTYDVAGVGRCDVAGYTPSTRRMSRSAPSPRAAKAS